MKTEKKKRKQQQQQYTAIRIHQIKFPRNLHVNRITNTNTIEIGKSGRERKKKKKKTIIARAAAAAAAAEHKPIAAERLEWGGEK